MDELLFMLSLSNNHNPFSVVRFIGHAFSPEASNKYYAAAAAAERVLKRVRAYDSKCLITKGCTTS